MRAVLVLVAVVSLVAIGVALSFDPARGGEAVALLPLGVVYAVLAAGALRHARAQGELRTWLAPRWGDVSRGFAFALLLLGGAYFVLRGVAASGPRAAWVMRLALQLGDPRRLQQHQLVMTVGLLLAATLEEVVWRGWARTCAEEWVGARAGWLVAAGLYALAHLPTAWRLADPVAGWNPMVCIAALGTGAVWGAMTRMFGGRLAPAIICHTLFDWGVVTTLRPF